MNCPNCGAQMQPGPIRGQKRCRYCETIVDERPLRRDRNLPGGPFSFLADHDGDGTPDILQMSSATSVSHTQVETSYEIDGKHYASIEEVPEEYRKLLEDAAPVAVPAPPVVQTTPVAPRTLGHRVKRHEEHAAWTPRTLERPDTKPGWLKPFVLGLLTALLLGWLLFG
jgi:hypothetical protein